MKHIRAILILLSVASPALAEPANDAWAMVPALPTACYTSQDDFPNQAFAASDALQQAKGRQAELNAVVSEQYRNMDPMEQQQRMVEFMMANPEETQRVMEAMQQGGMAAQEQLPEAQERIIQLDDELAELTASYRAALKQMVDPIEQRRQADRNTPQGCTPAALAEDAELNKEQNRAYDALCASWWKEGGAFHAWMAKFKHYQIDWAAQQDALSASAMLNYQMMGLNTDQVRSTYAMDAQIEYLRRAREVFFLREHSPLSEVPIERCGEHG